MMAVIALFLILIFLTQVVLMVGLYFAWQRVSVFLTWNTKYDTVDYQNAITTPKITHPYMPPSKTEQKGRHVQQVPDLIDITEVPFEEGFAAIVEAGESK